MLASVIDEKCWLFNGRIVFDVCPFENETLTVCRNVCNYLPSNVATYNGRKVALFIRLWKQKGRVTA
jgi:hypothetical protein